MRAGRSKACICSTRTSKQILAMRWKPQAVLHVACRSLLGRRSGWPQAMCLPRTLVLIRCRTGLCAVERPGPTCAWVPNPRAPRARRLQAWTKARRAAARWAFGLPPADISRDALPRWTYGAIALLEGRAVDRAVVQAGGRRPHGRGRAAGTAAAPGRWMQAVAAPRSTPGAGPMWARPSGLAQLNAAEAAAYKK